MALQPTTISKRELNQRWDLLPMPLREEMVSERTSEIIWKTCEGEHLSEEKSMEVGRIASWVLAGFLHPEDVANEVKLSTGIHPEIASRISQSLSTKLFAPIREELDAIYAPPGTDPKIAAAAPILVEEIRHPEKADATLQKLKPEGKFFTEPESQPVSLEELGEKVKGEKVEENAPVPFPNFTDLPPEPSASSHPPTFSPSTPEEGPAPFLIHEEAKAPELPRVEDFSLNIKPEEFGPSMPEIEAPPQADIEIGEAKEEPRTVHYGDMKTPLSAEGETSPLRPLRRIEARGGEPTIPETPLSAVREPSEPPPPNIEPQSSNINDMSAPLDLSSFGGIAEPEMPPAPPTSAPPSEPLPKPPKKPGFFARLFGRKNPPADRIDIDLPPAPEAPDAPPLPPNDEPPVPPTASEELPPTPPLPKDDDVPPPPSPNTST